MQYARQISLPAVKPSSCYYGSSNKIYIETSDIAVYSGVVNVLHRSALSAVTKEKKSKEKARLIIA